MAPQVTALPAADDLLNAPSLVCTSSPDNLPWLPVLSSEAPFPLEVFFQVCEAVVQHPERNSTSILRADILSDSAQNSSLCTFRSYDCYRALRRRILPRRPFDGILDQDCLFYKSTNQQDGLVVLLPILEERSEEAIPYYHPKVAGIAFRYYVMQGESSCGRLQVDFLPLQYLKPPEGPACDTPYWSETSREYRTALALLSTIHKFGKSSISGQAYVKRVHHDTLVPREAFQDLYLQLKEKYIWILDAWKEKTDPIKHVFEDVAILTFLILLWKDLYYGSEGRPPGGFVDVGCGNGLLVYLLMKEGYPGYGFDLRSRKSWELWDCPSILRVSTASPPELCLADEPPFPPGSFLIGNHADELTPWLPLLAALTPGSVFMNIPCCLHTYTTRFTAGKYAFPEELLQLPSVQQDMETFDSLAREKGGRYNAYLTYIAEQTVRAGWRPEREALRIPSTKCWAFVGRKRTWTGQEDEQEQEDIIKDWIRQIAAGSKSTWKPRESEVKDH